MKILYLIAFTILLSCNNENEKSKTESDKIEELNKKVEELTEKDRQAQEQKEREAAEAKAKEVQGNKELIIEQIKMGEGLVLTYKLDPIGTGGIKGSFTLENALSGIVFQVITVETSVYLSNGDLFDMKTHTFTNVKPGDVRPRDIPSTGNRGTKFNIRVSEIQSKWLTDGKLIPL